MSEFLSGSSSSSALREVLQDERDGGRSRCDSLVWETAGPKIKGNSFIILFAARRHHSPWQTFEDRRLWWKWNFIFWCLLSCVWPLRPVTPALSRDTTGWLRLQFGPQRVMRTKWAIEDWRATDSVCVSHSLKPGSDENLKPIGCIRIGLVWLPVV